MEVTLTDGSVSRVSLPSEYELNGKANVKRSWNGIAASKRVVIQYFMATEAIEGKPNRS